MAQHVRATSAPTRTPEAVRPEQSGTLAWPPCGREPTRPAWLISIVVHAVLVVLLGFLLRASPRGVLEEPGRVGGIVLKHLTEQGELFEGQQEQGTESTRESGDSQEVSVDSLVTAAADAALAEALPTLPTRSPGALEEGALGDAGRMTTGGGGGRPSGLAGGKATVRVFGTEGTGHKFVYLFDRSVSMEGARMAAAQRELIGSLESLENTHQFQIIFFNHDVHLFDLTGGQQRVAFASEDNKKRAAQWVRRVSADGGTDRVPALSRAIALRPDVIFFLTDADDPMSAYDLDLIQRRNRGRATINAIEFGSGPPHGRRNFLARLAEQSRGQYVYLNTRRFAQ